MVACAGGQQAAGMAVTSGADGGYMDLMTCEQAAHVILEAGATGEMPLLTLCSGIATSKRIIKTQERGCIYIWSVAAATLCGSSLF